MRVEITFDSRLADGPQWHGDGPAKPAGFGHANVIRSHLAALFPLGREPWNEEDYAWEFQVNADDVTVSILVGQVPDEGWRVHVIPVAFMGFLRRRKTEIAANRVADAIAGLLNAEPHYSNVRRCPVR